ncbi:MAG: hypothetical protein HONBIEJF_02685 [Fimbriimonadaceae bacterium]|nr:hypothetical protein [Fimbriimonadaceae bacterium]
MESEIIAVAFGADGPEVVRHAAACPRCGLLMSQFRKIADRLAEPTHDAPASLLKTVKAMALPKAVRRARLLSLTFAGSGARSAQADTLVAVIDAEGSQVQLLYRQSKAGWEVRGRLESPGWTIVRGGKRVRLDRDGGFVLRTKGLSETDFTLQGPAGSVFVPAADEWTEDDSPGSR